MEYLSNSEVYNQINAMTNEEFCALLDSIGISYSIINGTLINKENIIKNLTGISPNVIVTYTWNGERKEEPYREQKGCKSCGS